MSCPEDQFQSRRQVAASPFRRRGNPFAMLIKSSFCWGLTSIIPLGIISFSDKALFRELSSKSSTFSEPLNSVLEVSRSFKGDRFSLLSESFASLLLSVLKCSSFYSQSRTVCPLFPTVQPFLEFWWQNNFDQHYQLKLLFRVNATCCTKSLSYPLLLLIKKHDKFLATESKPHWQVLSFPTTDDPNKFSIPVSLDSNFF